MWSLLKHDPSTVVVGICHMMTIICGPPRHHLLLMKRSNLLELWVRNRTTKTKKSGAVNVERNLKPKDSRCLVVVHNGTVSGRVVTASGEVWTVDR